MLTGTHYPIRPLSRVKMGGGGGKSVRTNPFVSLSLSSHSDDAASPLTAHVLFCVVVVLEERKKEVS